MTLPSLYKPTRPEHFIGPARAAAERLAKLVARYKQADNAPFKVVFIGPPGVGKSALADFLTAELGASKWSVHKFNGTQLKVEQVEELARSLHYTDLFGGYRILRVEEFDSVPTVAQVNLLTLLDDLPPACAAVCTSNKKLTAFEERNQTRYIVFELRGPTDLQLREFLVQHWPELRPAEANQIATLACGNVRAALLDADLALAA